MYLFSFMLLLTSVFSAPDAAEIRSLYLKAIDDSKSASSLQTKTKSRAGNSGFYRAYYATGLALEAKHSWSPATKLGRAKDAAGQFTLAVAVAPNDLEVRFLRFSFEVNVPSVVGITTHIKTDKSFILSHLDRNHPMWSTMKSFLSGCSALTAEEKKNL